jgi:hypothetical protein
VWHLCAIEAARAVGTLQGRYEATARQLLASPAEVTTVSAPAGIRGGTSVL